MYINKLTRESCVFKTSETVFDVLPIECNHFKISIVKSSVGSPVSLLILV